VGLINTFEAKGMHMTLHIETTVLPGNRVEFSAPGLPEGARVEVTVVVPQPVAARMSMIDFLKTLPPRPLVFKTPAEADEYLQEERNSWDR
jgi:hypothetical protein